MNQQDRHHWQRVDEVFTAVVETPPPQRVARLNALCDGDAAVRADVSRLLASDGCVEHGFLAPPAGLTPPSYNSSAPAPASHSDLETAQRWVGRRIGGFTLTRCIGVGGMGVVYEAAQERPRRTVALKLILGALASAQRLHRFVAEAEILADLHHPNIAQVYEAGAGDGTLDASPYMAMELIPGAEPITQHARDRRMDCRARLHLFLPVCDAVQYLHQRGVIHRDLKPANILVDDAGRPRVIDFGVARLVQHDSAATRVTDARQLVGTLAYMSPEQLSGDAAQVDTRCDVYALGVILFELLTGRLPYMVRTDNLPAALGAIQGSEPISPAALDRSLRGDLDTILLKALEKDRQRRYASASELAADLRRFLQDEPIAARPPSALYQIRKFARRHRALTGGAALALSGLVFGTVVAARQAAYATGERNRAVAAGQQAQQEAARAAAEAAAAVRVSNCLGRVLSIVDRNPANAYDSDEVSARKVLDQATAAVTEELKDQPLTQARLLQRLGTAYRNRGLFVQARDAWKTAYEIPKPGLSENDFPVAESAEFLGIGCYDLGDYDAAERLFRESAAGFGDASLERQQHRAFVLHSLGEVLSIRGRAEESAALFQEALELRRRVLGEAHWSYGSTLFRLTLAQIALKDHDAIQARRLDAQRLMELSATLTETNPHRSGGPLLLGTIALQLGDPTAAEPFLRDSAAIRARQLGADAFLTAYAENTLGECLFRLGQPEEAEALLTRSIPTICRWLASGNVMVVDCVKRTADFYEQTDEPESAQSFRALLPSTVAD